MKTYSSFSAIDKQLRILNLKREIDLESFKLNMNKSKSGLYPTQILGGYKGILQKALLTFVLKKLKSIRKSKQLAE